MDVSVMMGDIKFNYRVATIIKNNNKVLLHKCIDDDFYAIPGGRIKIGEDSTSALKRELLEEIGASLKVNKLIGMIENFFKYDLNNCHEVMLIYESEIEDSKFGDRQIIKGIEPNSKVDLVWKDIEDIPNMDIRPAILKKYILNKQNEFFHVINNS